MKVIVVFLSFCHYDSIQPYTLRYFFNFSVIYQLVATFASDVIMTFMIKPYMPLYCYCVESSFLSQDFE